METAIRSVSRRDLHGGVFHIIPFSSVDMVSNYVKDYGYFVCDMGVASREDVEEAKQAMLDAFAELKGDPEQASGILDKLEWFGVNSFGDSAVMLRARTKCVPARQASARWTGYCDRRGQSVRARLCRARPLLEYL